MLLGHCGWGRASCILLPRLVFWGRGGGARDLTVGGQLLGSRKERASSFPEASLGSREEGQRVSLVSHGGSCQAPQSPLKPEASAVALGRKLDAIRLTFLLMEMDDGQKVPQLFTEVN